jgi:hypothetical protein
MGGQSDVGLVNRGSGDSIRFVFEYSGAPFTIASGPLPANFGLRLDKRKFLSHLLAKIGNKLHTFATEES